MSTPTNTPFDYVIVGGGTAGLVLANRLTEDPATSVAVLEAGENHLQDPRVNVPALWSSLLGSEMDWRFASTPQSELADRSIKLPAGRILGGSSALNAQTLVAPSKAGIDGWERLGNRGWGWSSLAPYYRKFYTSHLPDQATRDHLGLDWVNESVRGTCGPIQASFTGTTDDPVARAWVEAFKSMHHSTSADPFTGQSVGAYSNMSTIDPVSKTRSYAASAYAAPAMERPNFSLFTATQVRRVLLSPSASDMVKATGVEIVTQGELGVVRATNEVIVSAGVFGSPKLLELSGVGGEALLKQHEIPVIINNPNVGEHMQDHLLAGISYELVEGVDSLDPLMRREPEALKKAQELYATKKEGPLAVGGVGSHAYMPIMEFTDSPDGEQRLDEFVKEHLRSPSSRDEAIVSDVITRGEDGSGAYFLLKGQGVTHENEGNAEHGPVYQQGNFASIGTIQTHPLSRGSCHIATPDAAAAPIIDPGYFTHHLDMEIMARHLLGCERMRHTEPLRSLFKPEGRRNHVRAQIQDLEGARQYLRETARTTYHCCGTCSMRPLSSGGVVGPDLVVYGTSNLRVVDASIFPLISRGNTMSTVYAVAEKAADMIKHGIAEA